MGDWASLAAGVTPGSPDGDRWEAEAAARRGPAQREAFRDQVRSEAGAVSTQALVHFYTPVQSPSDGFPVWKCQYKYKYLYCTTNKEVLDYRQVRLFYYVYINAPFSLMRSWRREINRVTSSYVYKDERTRRRVGERVSVSTRARP